MVSIDVARNLFLTKSVPVSWCYRFALTSEKCNACPCVLVYVILRCLCAKTNTFLRLKREEVRSGYRYDAPKGRKLLKGWIASLPAS